MTSRQQDHLDAALAVLNFDQVIAYSPEQLKKIQALPPAYVRVTIERRPGGVLRTARTGRRSYRLILECYGRTETKARDQLQKAEDALEGVELLVEETYTTPLIFEPGAVVDEADEKGWFSGQSSYYYAH